MPGCCDTLALPRRCIAIADITRAEPRPRETPWAASPLQVLRELDADARGLTTEQAAGRLAEHGRNELPHPRPKPWWRRLLGQLDDVLVYILMAAAVLKAITGDWVDFAVIAAVIAATALIGFVQEGRAATALAGLQRMQSLQAQALRDGAWGLVDAAALVPGDVVRVRGGDRVPADVRLLEEANLLLDESALTGESVAATKQVEQVEADAGIGDRATMLFSGTIVTAGTGTGVVVATGPGTEIGRISSLVAEQEQIDTPLTRQLAHLGKQLSIGIGMLAFAMLLVGRLVHDFSVEELISAAIGFAVAAVPEGLPALVTITLALGVQQMARRRAITRTMSSVETLGSVTTICSDKTGTLTQNEMTARSVVTAVASYAVDGAGYDPAGRVLTSEGMTAELTEHADLGSLALAVGVCNDARVERGPDGWRVVGQPTEGALDVLARKAGAHLDGVRRLAQVPFDSLHKFSATLDDLDTPDGAVRVIHMVGAPDRLLDRCAVELGRDGERPLDAATWLRRIDELSSRGLRVLAAARRPAAGQADLTLADLDGGMTFLGIVGIVDPPRPEATAAVAEAHRAGIRVKMITGDHKGTAVAIASELGVIGPEEDPVALTGADIEHLTQDELRQLVRTVDVYARTSPEHKLRIVRALQSLNPAEVVAMTGDGVNDAPAITRADVGVAMGIKGTEATKDAADIVLADDNFATIERAVEEGRRIYDNIRKSVVFLLPTNGAQALVILVAVLLGMALPLSPVQILWINLVTSVTLSLALAREPAEPGIMERPPRSPREHVLSPMALLVVVAASVVIGGATLLVYLLELRLGGSQAQAQTTAVLMLALGQLAFLLCCRLLGSLALTPRVLAGNPAIWWSAAALLVLQVAFTYAPFMHAWFGSAVIGPREWGMTAGFAVGVFLAIEGVKVAARRWAGRR